MTGNPNNQNKQKREYSSQRWHTDPKGGPGLLEDLGRSPIPLDREVLKNVLDPPGSSRSGALSSPFGDNSCNQAQGSIKK